MSSPSNIEPIQLTLLARRVAGLLSGGLLAALCCCESARCLQQEEMASTHLAVLSATPWDDFRAQLAPAFDLSANDAKAAVVPSTVQVEQSVLDAFRLKVGLQLAPSAVLDPGFGTPAGPGPGRTAAGSGIPAPSPGELPSSPTAPAAIIDPAKLGAEPFLQHSAATALFQEVKLLERYIQDAVQRDDYRAYIVRLQLTNMPFRRDQPFDTYANISFFMQPVWQVPTAPSGPRIHSEDQRELTTRMPVVVPLLATDQVEAALVSQRAEQLRQLGLAVAAAYAGIGGKVDADKLDQAVRSGLGRDYNSLFTIGRLADNTIRVRIGAWQLPPSAVPASKRNAREREFQTLAQTHSISLLLLVPDSKADTQKQHIPIYVGMRTEYRDPVTGVRAGRSVGTPLQVEASVKAILKEEGIDEHRQASLTKGPYTIASDAQNGRYREFIETFGVFDSKGTFTPSIPGVTIGQVNSIWSALVAARIGAGCDVTEFHVPFYELRQEPQITANHAFLVDDGATTTAVIDGVKGIDPLKAGAEWILRVHNREVHLAASAAALRGRSQLVLTFPSILKTKLIRSPEEGPAESEIALSHPGLGSRELAASASYAGWAPTDTVKITRNKKRIVLDEDSHASTVQLSVLTKGDLFTQMVTMKDGELLNRLNDGELFTLTADGATIGVESGEKIIRRIPNSQIHSVAGTGDAVLKLTDLMVGTKVKLVLTPPKGAGDETILEFDVVGAAKRDSGS